MTRCALLLCTLAALAPGQALPSGFVSETVATGLNRPTGVAQLPDGRFLITEQTTGQIKLVLGTGASGVLGGVPGVATSGGEVGLLGIAIDPNWPATPRIYVHATRGAPSRVELIRFDVQGDLSDPASLSLSLGGEFVLLSAPDTDPFHNGGSLKFGPDGMLYMTLGDDGRPCDSLDVETLIGKVLRLDVSAVATQTGAPPSPAALAAAGNPFTGPLGQLVWATGFRNPFSLQIDGASGDVLVGDVGQTDWEELNVIDQGALDFGWPILEGPLNYTTCSQSAPPSTSPAFAYDHGGQPAAVILFCAPYRNAPGMPYAFGPAYEGVVFAGDFSKGAIRALSETPAGWQVLSPVAGQTDPDRWGQQFFASSSGIEGADGALYITRLVPGELRRIRPGASGLAVTIDSGDGQRGSAGQPLPNPLVVLVRDSLGNPVSNVPVSFSMPSGGGILLTPAPTTGADGRAATSVVLDVATAANPIPVVATTGGGSSVVFQLRWRGMTASYNPLMAAIDITFQHSELFVPITVVLEIGTSAVVPASTVYGPVFVDLVTQPPTQVALDGIGLFGPPNPALVTGPVGPSWSLSVPLPPVPFNTLFLFQGFALNTSLLPAWDAVVVTNPVILYVP